MLEKSDRYQRPFTVMRCRLTMDSISKDLLASHCLWYTSTPSYYRRYGNSNSTRSQTKHLLVAGNSEVVRAANSLQQSPESTTSEKQIPRPIEIQEERNFLPPSWDEKQIRPTPAVALAFAGPTATHRVRPRAQIIRLSIWHWKASLWLFASFPLQSKTRTLRSDLEFWT